MWITILIAAAIMGACLFAWIISQQKAEEARKDKPVQYLCHSCGEKHCDCHRENEADEADEAES